MADTALHVTIAAGQAALAQGDVSQALRYFIDALTAAPENPSVRRACFATLGLLDGYKLPQEFIAQLSECADDPAIDPAHLPRIARNILARDSRWGAFEPGAPDSGWFYTAPLLLAALERATVTDEILEHQLTRVRRHIVISAARDGTPQLLSQYPRFGTALVRQCLATRHMWTEQSDERAALKRVLKDDRVSDKYKHLLRGLYEPPDNPEPERADANALGAALTQLTAVDNDTSRKVKAQYESFPYPLWRDTALNQPMSWPEMITHFIEAPAAPIPMPDTPEVLVAGCGTGRSAAMMATLLPAAHILAVDLSSASLGYAAQKARELKLANITFGVADILRLGELKKSFHLIECGGVLHHMAEYQKGLHVLTDLLVPGGLMSLALYSERARQPIIAARGFVAAHKFPDDIVGMRAARGAIFNLPSDHPVRRITRRPDFYSADGLHDLIFNAHEVRFTPAGLKPLIASAGLVFLGFNISKAERLKAYLTANPSDPLGRDLDRWDEFEKSYNDTFQGMFQMWLQKPA